jgi:two-component system cell cycle sensor histidine kinase/response regulator CckA
MTSHSIADETSLPPRKAVHRDGAARRSGSILLVLIGAAVLAAAAAAFVLLGEPNADPYILGALALFAMIGVFSLFAFGAGILRLGPAESADLRPVERVFIGNPDVSEAVYRLLKAAREGKRQQEEVRIAGSDGSRPLAADAGPAARPGQARGEIRGVVDRRHHPRPRAAGGRVSGTAARIEYLDHAPAASSRSTRRRLVYVNATLANWLDHDLAEIGSGGLKLTDIVSGDGARC